MMTIGRKARRDDFLTIGSLERVNSSSKEPSNTIKINPIVPKMGKIDVRLGIEISKKEEACLTPHPKNSKRITDGILVFAEVISNMYAKSNKETIAIIIDVVI
jgi:hypothetical protein